MKKSVNGWIKSSIQKIKESIAMATIFKPVDTTHIIVHGIEYVAVDRIGVGCEGCCFCRNPIGPCGSVLCSALSRADSRNVIWVETDTPISARTMRLLKS